MTELILGGPGSGKTTEIRNRIEDIVKKGVSFDRIGLVSFTKSAVTEAIDRFSAYFKRDRKSFDNFRTLHSFSYRETGTRHTQIITAEHKRSFTKQVGLEGYRINTFYSEDFIDDRSIHLFLHDFSRNRLETVKDSYARHFYDTPLNEIEYIIRAYEEYKRQFNIKDFTDLLKEVLECPGLENDLDYIFLDEAQDLTPLQWKVFYNLFGNVKNIFIAGDDRQAIYSWSGVDVNNFLQVPYDKRTSLEISRRLPSNILAYSESIADKIKDKYDKTIRPIKGGGEVQTIPFFPMMDIIDRLKNKESIKLVFRNKCFSEPVEEELVDYGIPYYSFDNFGNRVYSVSRDKVYAILLHENIVRKEGLRTLLGPDRTKWEVFGNPLKMSSPWYEAFSYMGDEDKRYIKKILLNGLTIKEPYDMEVTTIHRAKGKEADNIYISSDITEATNNNYIENPDEEHRVFYVGITRAKKNLFIIEPSSYYAYEWGDL